VRAEFARSLALALAGPEGPGRSDRSSQVYNTVYLIP